MASTAESSQLVSPNISSNYNSSSQLPQESFWYDVFVSFRGSDSRDGITRTLVRRLRDLGVEVFFDETCLEKGEKLDELLNYIKKSRMFILIISEQYGESNWCLKEMSEIVDTGRKVIPVFYKVPPKDVKHQTGKFGDVFRDGEGAKRCGKSYSELIETMKVVGNTSGYVLNNDDDSAASSAEILEANIVLEVMCKLEKMLGMPFAPLI